MSTPPDLVESIRAAFPPHPINFTSATAGGMDGRAYRQHVDGRSWEDLDAAYLVKRNDALSFLRATHLAEVLPAYLLAFVAEGTRTPLPDTLLLVLDPTSETRFWELFALLSAAQRDAVIASLDRFAATERGSLADAARAASTRWNQRLDASIGT